MNMPEPSAGHRRLEELVGVWEGEETMHPSQWDPKGGTAFGRNRHELALDGFAMMLDYEQIRDDVVTFTGHGVYTYDPKTDQYTLHWFDSMGSLPEAFVGGFAGGVLTLENRSAGKHARMTYDFSEPETMKGAMEMSPDGKDWKLLFEATYTRV